MPNYILETKLNINGRLINCKVTGAPGSERDGAPFILDIRGGPGQGMSTVMPDFFAQHRDQHPAQHWILFDALGCGESDRAENPDEEYSVEYFTHIAARVVEEVKKQLQLPNMNLGIVGGSFGGTIALNVPRHRPEWTEPDSPVRLQAIFPFIAPLGLKDCLSKDFASKLYANDPRLPEYLRGIDMVLTGSMKNREDYISHVLAGMAPTYGKDYNTFFIRTCLAILKKYPNGLYRFLQTLKHIKPFRAFAEKNIAWVYQFSYEVTNYLFKNNYHGFELENKFKENPDLVNVYNKISIFSVYGASDICTSGEKSLTRLQNLLPGMGSFLHPGKHHDNYVALKNLAKDFFSGDIAKFEAALRDNTTTHDVVRIPPTFRDNYIASYQARVEPLSTAAVLSALDNPAFTEIKTIPSVQIAPEPSHQEEARPEVNIDKIEANEPPPASVRP